MNALPMLCRCFEAQWRGLTADERYVLERHWEETYLPSAGVLKASHIAQLAAPLWTAVYPHGCSLTLLSVKEDYLGDAPR